MFSTDGAPRAAGNGPETAPRSTIPAASTGSAGSAPGTSACGSASLADWGKSALQIAVESWCQDVRDTADEVLSALLDGEVGITDANAAVFHDLLASLKGTLDQLSAARLEPPAPADEPYDRPVYGVRTRNGEMI